MGVHNGNDSQWLTNPERPLTRARLSQRLHPRLLASGWYRVPFCPAEVRRQTLSIKHLRIPIRRR